MENRALIAPVCPIRLGLAAYLLVGAGLAIAAPGDLDPSFGTGGVVVTDPGASTDAVAEAIAVQPDGRIVAVGQRDGDGEAMVMVARYEADGSLDSSFGTGGLQLFAPLAGAGSHYAFAVALQTDGAVLVGGQGTAFVPPATIVDFGFVSRLLPTGVLDPSFGTDGTALLLDTLVQAAAVLGDGRILAAGWGDGHLRVRRLTSSGSSDATFGTAGVTTVTINRWSTALALAIAADDGIVLAGLADDAGPIIGNCGNDDFAVVRLEASGTPDPMFGVGGVRTTALGPNTCDQAHGLVLEPDGQILVAGFSMASSGPPLRPGSFALARYDTAGTLDPAFGSDGIVTTRIGTVLALGHALALQPNGQAIVGGQVFAGVVDDEADFDFALARYRPNGRLDGTFGAGGIVVTPSGPTGIDDVRSLALQPDGRLVAGGARWTTTGHAFALARYLVAECGPGASGTCRPVADDCDVAESCDGIEVYCPPDGFAGDGAACDDGDACTTGAACITGVCGTPVADGTACSDGMACTAAPETCTEGVCVPGAPVACAPCEACDAALGCVGTPAAVCAESTDPRKSILTMKRDADPGRARLAWTWAKGEATAPAAFGTPDVADAYQVCLFDQSTPVPSVLFRATLPGGGQCDGKPCWRPTSKGFKFRDRAGAHAGITLVHLRSGVAGKSRVAVKGAGATLALPALPAALPLRMELRAATGACFATTHGPAGVVRNDAAQLRVRGE